MTPSKCCHRFLELMVLTARVSSASAIMLTYTRTSCLLLTLTCCSLSHSCHTEGCVTLKSTVAKGVVDLLPSEVTRFASTYDALPSKVG